MSSQEKQKYILLSKIAKEKKYAQEYLSLLARRGDLGSIRIGKRWYTTEQWMNEFIQENARRKEEIASPVKILQPEAVNARVKELIEKVEVPLEVELSPKRAEIEEKNEVDPEEDMLKTKESFFERELVFASDVVFQNKREIKSHQSEKLPAVPAMKEVKSEVVREEVVFPIAEKKAFQGEQRSKLVASVQAFAKVRYEKPLVSNIGRKPVRGEIIDLRKMVSTDQKNILARQVERNEPAEKIQQVVPTPAVREEIKPLLSRNQYSNNEDAREYEARRDVRSFSPDFSLQDTADVVWQSLFSKLAISFVTLLLLLVLSGGLIFQKDLREIAGNKAGQVAGVSNSRVGSARIDASYLPGDNISGNGVSGIPLVKSAVHDYIDGTNNRIRENISLSRVILESAVRKEQSQ